MSEVIDLYFSFRSPYSYLSTFGHRGIARDFEVAFNLKPVLPTAVREPDKMSTENPNFGRYIIIDSARRAEFLGLPYAMPDPDPVVQDMQTFVTAKDQPLLHWVLALAVEANRQGRGLDFASEVSKMIFGGTKGWNAPDKMEAAANRAGLSLAQMEAAIAVGDHADEVRRNYADLQAAGHWGVPTMVLRGEPFFGQDRVDLFRWRLKKLGIPLRNPDL